jgi:hypothetical protein
MASLKPFTFKLAPMLGMTPSALYERQRALVRAGLLVQGRGRGPGSGVQATASTVALLLIAALATGNLSNADVCARDIATAKQLGDTPHTLKARTFHEALTSILSSKTLSLLVTKLVIYQSVPWAEIHLARNVELFGTNALQKSRQLPGVRVTAEIDGDILRQIATNLAAVAGPFAEKATAP